MTRRRHTLPVRTLCSGVVGRYVIRERTTRDGKRLSHTTTGGRPRWYNNADLDRTQPMLPGCLDDTFRRHRDRLRTDLRFRVQHSRRGRDLVAARGVTGVPEQLPRATGSARCNLREPAVCVCMCLTHVFLRVVRPCACVCVPLYRTHHIIPIRGDPRGATAADVCWAIQSDSPPSGTTTETRFRIITHTRLLFFVIIIFSLLGTHTNADFGKQQILVEFFFSFSRLIFYFSRLGYAIWLECHTASAALFIETFTGIIIIRLSRARVHGGAILATDTGHTHDT